MTLASGRNSPWGIAVDAVDVYWMEDKVYKCAIGRCNDSPAVVAGSSGWAVAVDAAHVYWTEQGATEGDGRIMMIAK